MKALAPIPRALVRALPWVAMVALAACQPGQAPAGTDVAVAPSPPTVAPAAAPVADARLRGRLLVGKDGYAMTACGSSEQQIVALSEQARAMLDRFTASGALEFQADARITRPASGAVRIEAFELMALEGDLCGEDLANKILVARGTEPFWSLQLWPDRLLFERPDMPPLAKTFDAGHAWTGSGLRIEGLEIELQPGPCSDGMSDGLYGWIATVRVDGQSWQGCAYRGLAASAVAGRDEAR